MLVRTLNPAAELDAFFKPHAFLRRQRQAANSQESDFIRPQVDISEDKIAFHIHAELPGIKSSDVKIAVDKNVLTISGKKLSSSEKSDQQEKKEDDNTVHMVERRFGEFSRSFTLPNTVNAKNLKATFNDGLLSLNIPKKEEDVQQSFEIEISG